jgi:hypothetical protein
LVVLDVRPSRDEDPTPVLVVSEKSHLAAAGETV